MIIKSVSAENVLKYARLDLKDIPEHGIIAICGQNESGKSTIGETVCFALYGRTFSVGPDELEKVIRWGEVECSAKLVFSVGDGNDYEVVRYLDSDGNHSARLSRVGEEEASLARGVSAVRDRLYQLIGYDYDQFIDSFYLAQREITTPHAHGYTVKTMAGIAPLERCAQQFEEEISTEEEVVVDTESQGKVFQQELKELDIDPHLLPALEEERQEVGRKEAEFSKRVEALEHASVNYQDNAPKMWAAQKKRGVAGFMRWLMLLLAVLTGGSWLLLSQAPGSPVAKDVQGVLSAITSGWNEGKVVYLLFAAVFFAVLFILFWMRRTSQDKLAAEYATHAAPLAEELADLPDDMWEDKTIGEGGPSGSGEGNIVDDGRPPREAVDRLRQRVERVEASPVEVRDNVGSLVTWMRGKIGEYQSRGAELDKEIHVERQRVEKGDQLKTIIADLDEKAVEQHRRIDRRELAIDLLNGAAKHISKRFNQELRGLVGGTLPLLTEGRYEHLQIDENLNVKVFSSEKRDFMVLDEISSGTQRQIMLAVRLALTQELINRTVNGDQFLFLDEPFAFFDEERTRSALAVLPSLSDEIAQIWIIAQEFPEDMTFDLRIDCAREYKALPPGLAG